MSFAWIDKQRLGETMRGTFLNLGSPLSARMAAQTGFDWVLIDLEHGAGTEETLAAILIAVEGSSCSPIVRVVSNNAESIKRALDLGAVGVMVPYVSSADEAAAAVSFTRYPPAGRRGVASSTIATGFGMHTDHYHRTASEKVLTVLQIETREAVDSADAIASVDGVDVLFVGPLDLSFNLGCPKNFRHREMREATDGVVAACRRHGKAPGILSNVEMYAEHADQGFTFLGVGSDGGALREGLARLRDVGANQV